MNISEHTEATPGCVDELLADADNLISAALGISSGPQGYCIFISARDDFRQKLVAAFCEDRPRPVA